MVCLTWKDGRTAMLHGLRARPHGSFGAILHRPKGAQFVDINDNKRPYYAGLMEAILQLPAGRQPVPPEQMLEVVAIMEAANRSLAEGKEVAL
jgi:predicted dehydrogenase